MKVLCVKTGIVAVFMALSPAYATDTYQLTVLNGSEMPISPPVIYFMNGSMGLSELGSAASPGFVKICQSGDPSGLVAEINAHPSSAGSGVLSGPILPGQKKTVILRTAHPDQHSVHIVSMYGKTKEYRYAINKFIPFISSCPFCYRPSGRKTWNRTNA